MTDGKLALAAGDGQKVWYREGHKDVTTEYALSISPLECDGKCLQLQSKDCSMSS